MTQSPLITLTTDFGAASPYVGVMKGVILSINPAAVLIDITHAIGPQDLRHANYVIKTAVPYFPPGSIHLCVVDPGVGSERSPLYVEANGRHLVGPDNGIFTGALKTTRPPAVVRRLAEHRYWLPKVSNTFHGRDIFAPVAAHLSLGLDPSLLGPEHANPVLLPPCSAVTFGNRWQGVVQFVDDFGNLITNVPACKLRELPLKVSVAGSAPAILPWVSSYSEAAPGELVSLFSSDGFFEIAEVNGNAARRLGVTAGAVVDLEGE